MSMASNTTEFLLTYQSVFLGLLTCLSSQQNLPLSLHACGHPLASRMLSLPFLSLLRVVLTEDLLASHQLIPKRKWKMPKYGIKLFHNNSFMKEITWFDKKKLIWLFWDTSKMWKAGVALWWHSIQYEKKSMLEVTLWINHQLSWWH